MALILNIETSSDNCSVAVSVDGEMAATLQSSIERSHASELTVLTGRLLAQAGYSVNQLDAVAVSKGPGSYTGLRIGVSVAKGLCYGASKPLIAIDTLHAMLNGLRMQTPDFEKVYPAETLFFPMLDARRQEVYLAGYYSDSRIFRETEAVILETGSFSEYPAEHKLVFFGSGSEKLKSLIQHPNVVFVNNFVLKAEYLVALAEEAYHRQKFEDVAYFEPFYLKDFVATVPRRKVI